MTMCRGKTALVTNASQNEGHAAAIALAGAGAQVLVHDDRATRKIARTVSLIQATGGVAEAITTDTTAPNGPDSLARQTRQIVGDRLDILVFNTASTNAPSNQSMAATFDAQMAARARAPFLLVQQLLPILSRGSSVIFTCRSDPTLHDSGPRYFSAFATIAGLTEHFSALLRASGVRVNALDLATDSKEPLESAASGSAKRSGNSVPSGADQQLGALVIFLASNDARQITGEMIQIANERVATPMQRS